MGGDQQALRQKLSQRWQELWPESGEPGRPPLFPGAGRAAERLRRLTPYRLTRVLAVGPEPCLLQARVNALNDNKSLLAATPSLKQGLVRLTPRDMPLPTRSKALRGWSLAGSGHTLRLPNSRPGKAEMLLVAALAVDRRGRILDDGRGLIELTWALLMRLRVINSETPVVVLAAEEQIVYELPGGQAGLCADLVVTPAQTLRMAKSLRPKPTLEGLAPALASLPVVRAVLGRGYSP